MVLDLKNYEPALMLGAQVSDAGEIATGNISATGTLAVTGASTFTGIATFVGGTVNTGTSTRKYTPTAVNSSATLTAAQIKAGYITTTSVAGVTMTMLDGTTLGTAFGAAQGLVIDFYVDNTAGANTVTMAVGTNAVQSDWDLQITAATASVTPAAITPLTVRSGVAGIGKYTIVFSSATAYTFSRTA